MRFIGSFAVGFALVLVVLAIRHRPEPQPLPPESLCCMPDNDDIGCLSWYEDAGQHVPEACPPAYHEIDCPCVFEPYAGPREVSPLEPY